MDISGFDTSQVTDIKVMFASCSGLEELDVSGFDTSQVTDMSSMFAGCSGLKELDVSGFATSQVTDMGGMFAYCSGLKELNLKEFNISQVTTMPMIFEYMNLSKIILPETTGDNHDTFVTELMSGMKSGAWRNVTEGIDYEKIPDDMQDGYEYINKDTYMTKEDQNTGIIIKNMDDKIFDKEIELITGNVSTDSNFSIYAEVADKLGKENLLYNIYLQKDGEMVQPDGQVQVSIPLPEGMKENAKVYYIAEDGTATDMNAEYMDGNLVFVTDHFSVYAVVNSSVLSGDIDGNGKVNLQDSALLRRYLAGWDVTIDENAADVDGNGKVNLQDSALLRRYLAGWDVTLK